MHSKLILCAAFLAVACAVPLDSEEHASVRQIRSPHLFGKKKPLLGGLFGGGNQGAGHYTEPVHHPQPVHHPEPVHHGGSASFATSSAGSSGHGSQSQSQSAAFAFGPFSASLSQSQSQGSGGGGFFDY